MKNIKFVYTMRGRVVWISDQLFHIPVVDDLYRVHQVDIQADVDISNCTNYVIEFFHKFAGNKILPLTIKSDDDQQIRLTHEKIKLFVKLSEFVNYSYQASLPLVFSSEVDKIEVLAESLMSKDSLVAEAWEKHHQFIGKLIQDKKAELKNRYLFLVHQIKNAVTAEEIQTVGYKIVFEGINVV